MSLFLSKKEIYKERKFSFFMVKDKKIAQFFELVPAIFDSFSLYLENLWFSRRETKSREEIWKISLKSKKLAQFRANSKKSSISKAFNFRLLRIKAPCLIKHMGAVRRLFSSYGSRESLHFWALGSYGSREIAQNSEKFS